MRRVYGGALVLSNLVAHNKEVQMKCSTAAVLNVATFYTAHSPMHINQVATSKQINIDIHHMVYCLKYVVLKFYKCSFK